MVKELLFPKRGEGKMRITALPCLCVDVFDGTDEIRPGGEELNFAVHAARFEDMEVVLLGVVGKDRYGETILKSMEGTNINSRYIRIDEHRTTANNMTYLTEEGDRYYKDDSWNGEILDAFSLTDHEIDIIRNSDVVVTHYDTSCFHEIIELQKKYKFRLAVDFDVHRDFDTIEEYCPYIEFFMISGSEEYLPIFKRFSEKYDGLFNMTLAKEGSVTYYQGKEYRVKADYVERVVDTTGCGDSYHAGFVCSYLSSGDILNAMAVGSKLAAETLSHFGGF